jgi:hypothetical protein
MKTSPEPVDVELRHLEPMPERVNAVRLFFHRISDRAFDFIAAQEAEILEINHHTAQNQANGIRT